MYRIQKKNTVYAPCCWYDNKQLILTGDRMISYLFISLEISIITVILVSLVTVVSRAADLRSEEKFSSQVRIPVW